MLFILIVTVCISFAGCKDPESNLPNITFDDIKVYVNSESGVQAGLHTPLIYIEDFEDLKSELGVNLSVSIFDQDENEIGLNEDGQFLVEYDKVYSIVYTLSKEGEEPKNYFATITALTSDMVEEPPQNGDENNPGEYDYLDFVTIDKDSCNVSAKTKFVNDDYIFTLPKNLIIPNEFNGRNVIGVSLFACSYIETVSLPSSVVNIYNFSFAECESLTDINLEYVKSIGKGAFKSCSKLKNLNLNSVETIGEEVFLRCSGLASIDIGEKLISIGYHAFKDCTALSSLILRSTAVINLSDTSLSSLGGITVYVPQTLLSEYQLQNPTINFKAIN